MKLSNTYSTLLIKFLARIGIFLVVFFLLGFFVLTLRSAQAAAGVNKVITFQGKVVNSTGTNVVDGTYDFVIKIYDGAGNGASTLFTESWTSAALFSSTMGTAPTTSSDTLVYSSNTNESTLKVGQILTNTTKSESVTITSVNTSTNTLGISRTRQNWDNSDTITNKIYVKDGVFRVGINSLNSDISGVNFNSDSIYMGVEFNSDGEMKPRIQYTAAPYAMNAEKVNGLTVTNTSNAPFSSPTTLKLGDGKTVIFNNTLTFSGTDSTTFTLPTSTDNLVGEAFSQTLTNKTIGSTGLTFSGAAIDIATASNENFSLIPNGTGRIGFGTTSPLAYLDVRSPLGTIPTASISAISSFASLLVDQAGVGDLFSASKSGASKFTVRNSGQIVLDTFNYSTCTALETVAGVLTCGSDDVGGAGGGSNWTLDSALGVLRPNNDTLDLLIGGTSTTSAKFAVLNMNGSGTPTASVAGNMIVMPWTNGAVGTGGRLGIGTTNPLAALGVVGTASFSASLTDQINPDVTFSGGSGSRSLAFLDGLRTDFRVSQGGPSSLTTAMTIWGNGNVTAGSANNSGQGVLGSFQSLSGRTTINMHLANTSSTLGAGSSIVFTNSSTLGSIQSASISAIRSNFPSSGGTYMSFATARTNATSPAGANIPLEALRISELQDVGIGVSNPIARLQVAGGQNGHAAAFIVDQIGDSQNDILAASSSGTTRLVINNNGNVGVGVSLPANKLDVNGSLAVGTYAGTTSGSSNSLIVSGNIGVGTTSPVAQMHLEGSSNVYAFYKRLDNNFNVAQYYAPAGAITTSNVQWLTGMQAGSNSFEIYNFDGSSTNSVLTARNTGNVGIGSTAPESTLHVAGKQNGARAALIIDQLATGIGSDLFTASASGTTRFSITNAGGIKLGASEGSNTQCLLSGGPGAASTWGSCGGGPGGSSNWTLNTTLGVLHPNITSTDLILGGTATASAKMAFINLLIGNPTIQLRDSSGSNPVTIANSSGNLLLSAPSGTVQVGSGTGNIGISLTNIADRLNATKTVTLGANASVDDFNFQRIYTGGAFTQNGSIVNIMDRSTGSGNSYVDLLKVDSQYSGGGGFFGSLLKLQRNGVDRFVVGGNGTSAVASVSGATSFAAFGTNQTGSGDLFTASASGTPKFTITNAGGIKLGTNQGASGQCLVSGGDGAAAAWGACGGPEAKTFADDTQDVSVSWTVAANVWDGTQPNITIDATGSQVLVSFVANIVTDDASDEQAALQVRRVVGASATAACTDTQVGRSVLGTFLTTSGQEQSLSGSFLDTGSFTAGDKVNYVICTAGHADGLDDGTVQGITVTLVEVGAAGADLAEIYYSNEEPKPGEVVSIDSTLKAGVKRSVSSYDLLVLGVVTTTPGLVIGEKGIGNPVMVALSGRVPVKVSSENGAIKPGDALTSSAISGVAMKATKAGPTIGVAMSGFDGQGVGTVMLYVKSAYYNGSNLDGILNRIDDDSRATMSDIGQGQEILQQLIRQKDELMESRSSDLSDVYSDRVAAGLEVITPRVVTQEVLVEKIRSSSRSGEIAVELGSGGKLRIKDNNGLDAITFDSDGNAVFRGRITADSIAITQLGLSGLITEAVKSGGLEIISTGSNIDENRISVLESAIASLSGRLDLLAQAPVLSASTTAVASDSAGERIVALLEEERALDAELSKFSYSAFASGGIATVSGDLRVTGNGFVEGIFTVVDTLTTKNLFVSGLTEFMGNVIFSEDVRFDGRVTFNPDTAGYATLQKDEKSVGVRFVESYEALPVIQATLVSEPLSSEEYADNVASGYCEDLERDACQEKVDLEIMSANVQYVVSGQSKEGFKIVLKKKAVRDYTFSWTAIAAKDRKSAERQATMDEKAEQLLKRLLSSKRL